MMERLFIKAMFVCLLLVIGTGSYGNAANQSLPLRVGLVLGKAAPLQAQNKYQEVISLLTQFQTKAKAREDSDADHPAINFALGNSYMLLEQYPQAISAYQQVIKTDQQHRFAWQNLANCQYQSGQYADATKAFEQAYSLTDPPAAELLYYASAAALMADDAERCVQLFERLLKEQPKAVTLKWRETLVHALLGLERATTALPHIEMLASAQNTDNRAKWQEILLYQYLEQKLLVKALNLAQALCAEDTTNPRWWKAITHIHLARNQYRKALGALTVYGYLKPLSQEQKKLQADLFLQEGIPLKAAPLYRDYLDQQQSDSVIKSLVMAYRQQGQAERALDVLEQVAKERSTDPFMLLRADLLYELERYDQAAELFSRCAKTVKKPGYCWLMTGYSYWHLERYNAAAKAFRAAQKYKNQQQAAGKALAQLKKIRARQG